MNVYINGELREFGTEYVTFDELREFVGINRLPTITYRSENREGSLCSGETLTLEPYMVINVVAADNS